MKQCTLSYEVVKTDSDTTSTTTTKITAEENTFTVEQVGNIKKVLIDSLRSVYGSIINQLTSPQPSPCEGEGEDTTSVAEYAYVSEIDTNFVAKDSSGFTTDSMHVKSTFISPDPLPKKSIHFLTIDHTSFTKKTSTETTVTNTITVKKTKGFWDGFHIGPNVSAGVGMITKQFDFYAGVGITYEF